MKCTHCNGEHPADFKFCPVTGKEMVQPFKACTNPECVDFNKHTLPPDALFCPRCGSRIESPQDKKGSQTVVNTKKKKRNSKRKTQTNRESRYSSDSYIYISNTVKEIIVKTLGVDRSEVVDSANLAIDLGADDLDLYELFRDFEGAFNIEMPDGDDFYGTVGDIIRIVQLSK